MIEINLFEAIEPEVDEAEKIAFKDIPGPPIKWWESDESLRARILAEAEDAPESSRQALYHVTGEDLDTVAKHFDLRRESRDHDSPNVNR